MRRLLAIAAGWGMWAALVLAGGASGAIAQPAVTQPATAPTTAPASQPTSQPVDRKAEANLSALSNDAEAAVKELSGLTDRFDADSVVGEVDSTLWPRKVEIESDLAENASLLSRSPSLEIVRQQQATLTQDLKQLNGWTDDLTRRFAVLNAGIGRLDEQHRAWADKRADVEARRQARLAVLAAAAPTTRSASRPAVPAGPPVGDVFATFLQRIDAILSQNEALRKRYDYERDRIDNTLLLTIQATHSSLSEALNSLADAQRRARDKLLAQDSPALWNALLHPMAQGDVTEQGRNSLANQWQAFDNYIGRQGKAFLFHLAGVMALAATLIWLRRRTRQWTGSDPTLLAATRVFQTPIATAITASMILTPWIYVAAPRLFWGLVGTAALLPTIVVLRPLIERSLRPLLYGLAVAIFVNLLLSVVAALPLVYRAMQLGQMGGAAVFFLWFLRTGRGLPDDPSRPPLRRTAVIGARFGLGITVFAGLANVFGYVALSRLIGNALLTSAYLGVLLDTSVHVIDALLLGLSHVQPFSGLGMVQRHRPMLLGRLHVLTIVLAVGLWGFFTLDSLTIRQQVFDTATAIWYWPSDAATVAAATAAAATQPSASIATLFTVGGVVLFVLSIVASIYAARFIAFLLDEDVYPRLKLARGMPYAISTLLRYVILAVGFSLAISNLGYDSSKLTILVSAFSIGLGFGLQNIVNNFVSGLILLFERPVQVGDVIELDNVTGVISRIGIRASVIRTPLAAEIIIPNGRLISDRVVNWTLSNRQRGVELSVTVAAGSMEPQKLISLLAATAKALPLVAPYPAPQAFFSDFSGGGMKFDVRAWTNRFEDWTQVRSELATAINAMLIKENVTLK